jgi:hypothetical protein
MNDISELWSLPWHALQRSLAETFGAEPTVAVAKPRPLNPQNISLSTGNWLVRARVGAPHANQAGR